jgi:hypothetical protein
VIDMLAYQREKWNQPGTQDIDYTTLDVQHLGSIYEGLLELQPHIADEPMVETVTDGKPVFKPQRVVATPRPIRGQPPRRINAGEVYLVTNRGERKATGSYYTPKYIVDYIVENTLGPLADEAAQHIHDALLPDVDNEIKKLEKTRREWEKTLSPPPNLPHQGGGTGSPPLVGGVGGGGSCSSPLVGEVGRGGKDQIANLNKAIEEQKRRLLEPYLSLNVLDPAMGSGHFLVGAADFLSLAMATDPNLPYLEEMGDEDPQIFYKRLVVERCLYGVDLNPLAVELAKLSLWLHTVSKDKALSFLDHHLRCGNSLIGARIEDDLMTEPPRFNARGKRTNIESQQLVFGFNEALSATHLQYFLDTFRKIMEAPSGDAEMERMKDKLYWQMDHVRDKFRAVANCWLAPYFGVSVIPEQYERAVRTLRNTDAEWQALTQEAWFQDAQAVAGEKRFFHWELEFPELFFAPHALKPKEKRGFDGAFGNPPYITLALGRGQHLAESNELLYFRDTYPKSSQYKTNTFTMSLDMALWLTITSGKVGMILPRTLLTNHFFVNIRELLLSNCRINNITEIEQQVFPEAEIGGNIVLVIDIPDTTGSSTPGDIAFWELDDTFSFRFKFAIPQINFLEIPDLKLLSNQATVSLLLKLFRECSPLGNLATLYNGIKTGDNKRFLTSSPSSPLHRKILRGRDINRYNLDFGDVWVLFDPEQLWSNTNQEMFESSPKIIIRQTGDTLVGALDKYQYYTMDTTHLIIPHTIEALYLLCLINSALMNWCHRSLVPEEGKAFAEVKIVNLQKLPIRCIEFTTCSEERARLLESSKQLYESYLAQGDKAPVLEFVEHQLTQKPERADVVHDLLAFLAEQMIAMNKEKHEEITGFLTWLERHIGAKVDDLSNKTKIRAYHDLDLDTLLSILRKNRRKLSVNPTTRAVQEPIETEFNASMAKLTPLKAKIAATDRLIDLIVYKLYGLTEEEIALVEGNPDTTNVLLKHGRS